MQNPHYFNQCLSVVRARTLLCAAAIALITMLFGTASIAQASFVTVNGSSGRFGHGPLVTFSVQVEVGITINRAQFARDVEARLFDRRSWGARGARSFRRVATQHADIPILLARPTTVDRLCAPLATNGYTSCFNNGKVVLNLDRWRRGVSHFPSLLVYRTMVVNHEVGHALGRNHANCPAAGARAPIMQQQTLSLQGCRINQFAFRSAGVIDTTCSLYVERTTPGHRQVRFQLQWPGRRSEVRIAYWDGDSWVASGTRTTDKNGALISDMERTWPVGTPIRVRFAGTPHLDDCSARDNVRA